MRIKTAEIINISIDSANDCASMAACLTMTDMLGRHGIRRGRLSFVGRGEGELEAALTQALGRADMVVLNGIFARFPAFATAAVCAVAKCTASEDGHIVTLQRRYHKGRSHSRPDYCDANARVPAGSDIFLPEKTAEAAYAMSFEKSNKCILCLPGEGGDLALYAEAGLDDFLKKHAAPAHCTRRVNLIGSGIGRMVREAERISGEFGVSAEVCQFVGEANIIVSANADTVSAAEKLCDKAVKSLKKGEAGKYIYGVDTDLASEIVRLLTKKKQTVTFAESCTGGLIAKTLVDIPGSSEVFDGSLVTYSNTVKHDYLGVRSSTLENDGAVSRKCAAQMAEGARKAMNADYGVAVTGIAGPGGGTPEKPVGLVYIAVSQRGESTSVIKLNLPGDRTTVRSTTVKYALRQLWREITGNK